MEIMSWLLWNGQGASAPTRNAGPWPAVRIIHVTDLLSECRSWTASNADLDPPRTTTLLICGEVRREMLAARSRVWIVGGVKLSLGKEGRLGAEVRPVAMMSFRQVKHVFNSVETVQRWSDFVICLTWLLNMIRSCRVFPEKALWVENASK